MKTIHTILIANRGEIAHRVIRTCRKLGIRSVAVYSDADRDAPYVSAADWAIHIGDSPAAASYLNVDAILAAAQTAGADAIHPGYGFLSENATFARRVEEAGFIFIGPNPTAIEAMGSKSRAKTIMAEHGVPVIPGYRGQDQTDERLKQEAETIGFPILLKAAAGGGGKGMRIVQASHQLDEAIAGAKREALAAFGDDELLIEKYFPSARHIEFQIFGDKHGNAVHLLERECSIQRRYQKIIEESPSPVLNEATRAAMGEAAVRAARAIGYDNAGTVEFIYISPDEFYFLEVNTRLQVEHPVTEAITGLDLVEWQILVAEGQPLPLSQEAIQGKGYALECRLYAEDPSHNFLPATGRVLLWQCPDVPGMRYDSAVQSGSEVSIFYDPMIAKVIAHGPDRVQTIRRMRYALGELACLGLTTNQQYLLRILDQPDFIHGQYDTGFVGQQLDLHVQPLPDREALHRALIAALLHRWQHRRQEQPLLKALPSGWRNNFYQYQEEHFRVGEDHWVLRYRYEQPYIKVLIDEAIYLVELRECAPDSVRFEVNGRQQRYSLVEAGSRIFVHLPGFGSLSIGILPRFPEIESVQVKGGYEAPMPGEVVHILVQPGQEVAAGDSLVVLSSMKMENTISAAEDGIVEEINVEIGQRVEAGTVLVRFKELVPETGE